MNAFATVLGLGLMSSPLLFAALAWRAFRRDLEPQAKWRRRAFLISLVGTTSSFVLFWMNIMIIPRGVVMSEASVRIYAVLGWTGEAISAIFVVCALMGSGNGRTYAAIAAAGVLLLYVSTGFY